MAISGAPSPNTRCIAGGTSRSRRGPAPRGTSVARTGPPTATAIGPGRSTPGCGRWSSSPPKLRQGSSFPAVLEPRQTAETALTAVLQDAWIQGVSTRKADDLVQALGQALGLTGLFQVPGLRPVPGAVRQRRRRSLDERVPSFLVPSFLERPLEGEWPDPWLDATDLKVRQNGRLVSIAAIIATGVNQDGRRELLGLGLGLSEAAAFWIAFLRGLRRRGLRRRGLRRRGLTGVTLVVCEAHEGLKAALTQVLGATWQRCRVHFMRSLLANVAKGQQTVVSAAVRQVFVQPDRKTAEEVWRHVADQLRPRLPKVAALRDAAEHDVLADMEFPEQHRRKLHSTNPIERLNSA